VTDQSGPFSPGTDGGAELVTLCQLIESSYGISIIDVRSLGGELDTNVWIRDSLDREYTIKTSRCSDPAEIRWQYPVLEHLRQRLDGIGVPTLIPTMDGDWDIVAQPGPSLEVIRLANWVPGQVIGSHPMPPERLLKDWGLLAANTVLALSDFESTEAPSTHYWDVRESLNAIESCLGFVEDQPNLRAVERLVGRAAEAVHTFALLPQQIVHQDLNDFNVIIDGESPNARITGLLDVGDTLMAPRLSELVVASAYSMLRQPEPLLALEFVVEGYSNVLPVPDDERALVRLLAPLRLCVNAVTWTKRAAIDGTEYGQRRMAATWPTIHTLAESMR